MGRFHLGEALQKTKKKGFPHRKKRADLFSKVTYIKAKMSSVLSCVCVPEVAAKYRTETF